MHSDKTAMALYDIRDNALYARQFVEGITFEAFQADRKTFYAVTARSKSSPKLPAAFQPQPVVGHAVEGFQHIGCDPLVAGRKGPKGRSKDGPKSPPAEARLSGFQPSRHPFLPCPGVQC